MPIRPFPIPLRTGVDICRLERIREAIKRVQIPHGSLQTKSFIFAARWMTPFEMLLALRRFPKPQHWQYHVQEKLIKVPDVTLLRYLAGRWAAKEAVIKTHPTNKVMRQVEIINIDKAPCGIVYDTLNPVFSRQQYEELYEWFERSHERIEYPDEWDAVKKKWQITDESGSQVPVSISHDGDYVVATALGELLLDPGPYMKARAFRRWKNYAANVAEEAGLERPSSSPASTPTLRKYVSGGSAANEANPGGRRRRTYTSPAALRRVPTAPLTTTELKNVSGSAASVGALDEAERDAPLKERTRSSHDNWASR